MPTIGNESSITLDNRAVNLTPDMLSVLRMADDIISMHNADDRCEAWGKYLDGIGLSDGVL